MRVATNLHWLRLAPTQLLPPRATNQRACRVRTDCHDVNMAAKTADEEFIAAILPARRIVTLCRAQADLIEKRLIDALRSPAAGTVVRADKDAAAGNAARKIALQQVVMELNSTSFAITSFVTSIEMHFKHEAKFYAASAAVLVRPLLDAVATGAWIIDDAVSTDMRHARGCVWTLRTVEQAVHDLSVGNDDPPAIVADLEQAKRDLVDEFKAAGVTVDYRVDRDTKELTDSISSVRIGQATAKAGFTYTDRVEKYVGSSTPYRLLSGVVHGEQTMLNSVTDHPATQARFIAWTTFQAVAAWSRAAHAYIGTDAAPFINGDDVERLKMSMPEELRHELEQRDIVGAES